MPPTPHLTTPHRLTPPLTTPGLPVKNQETFQLLRYNEGEFYKAHFDYIEQQGDMPCGARPTCHIQRHTPAAGTRVSTFFLYLNDVEEGGETYFPHVHLKVAPKRGRAVMWSAVPVPSPPAHRPRFNVELDTLQMHPLSRHEALPVVSGVKYGSNKWIHVRG